MKLVISLVTMSKSPSDTSVKKAIAQVIADFQANPERFWNERDIHWSLFHYIKLEKVIKEAYPTQLIRAEFPTFKVFSGRGHYDLVIINKDSYTKSEAQNMKAQTPWEEYLALIELDVAIEIKIWQARLNDGEVHELIEWDIRKLTEKPHKVKKAYFLNFVLLDFKRDHNEIYYNKLREYLSKQTKPGLNILCVPSDSQLQNKAANWL